MDSNKLKGKIRESGLSQEKTAEKVGISLSRFNAKINGRGGAEFSLGEVRALKEIFALDAAQVEQIFST